MIRFLLVHDRPEITSQIEALIRENVTDARIDVAEDGATARQKLSEEIYDQLIIDLTLPHMKGGGSDYHVADELLKELFQLETLNIPGDVIGLTRDADALASVNTSLGPHLMVTIEEKENGNWRQYLVDKINYAARAAITRQGSVNQHFQYDALLVTALDEEFSPYKTHLDLTTVRYFPGAYEFPFADKNGITRRGVAFSIGKSGQARAASITQSLLAYFRPRVAMMSGFCGGVEGKSQLGDLIIFDSSYDWDYGRWEQERSSSSEIFRSRPTPISIDGTASHRAARALIESDFNLHPPRNRLVKQKSLGKLNGFNMHMSPAAPGSAVVAHNVVTQRIRGLNESIRAIDMESYGFYFACSQTQVVRPEFICVKSVSDFCNTDKTDDFHEVCSEIAAQAILQLLTGIMDFDF